MVFWGYMQTSAVKAFCVGVALLATPALWAQGRPSGEYVGFHGGVLLNSHSADFPQLEGIPSCCPAYETGQGTGWALGVLYEYSFTPRWWWGVRLNLMSVSGVLRREEPIPLIVDGSPRTGAFEHTLEGNFLTLGIEPRAVFSPFGGLSIAYGFRMSYSLSSTFSQREAIVNPANRGTFLNPDGTDSRRRTRNEYAGDIPNAEPIQAWLLGGIGYSLPMNADKTLFLVPEVQLYLPLTELVTNTNWRVSPVSVGVALAFGAGSRETPALPPPRRYEVDTVRIALASAPASAYVRGRPVVTSTANEEVERRTDTLFFRRLSTVEASIEAVGTTADGRTTVNPELRVEEYSSNRLDPLLNYVFFDEGSAVIPSRYQVLNGDAVTSFSEDGFSADSILGVYYNLLNIVGYRMSKHPEATLRLTGCIADIGLESGGADLAKGRAESVREYLTDVWNIDPRRIAVEHRGLPERASAPADDPEKMQENRRVELNSSDPRILAPVFIRDTDYASTPSRLRFQPYVATSDSVVRWAVRAYQKGQRNTAFEASGMGKVPANIDWTISASSLVDPAKSSLIQYELEVETASGGNSLVVGVPLQINTVTIADRRTSRVNGFEVERFSLILFDFDKASIDAGNKRIVDIIRSRTTERSQVEISAYTDRTGDAQYNKRLAERRAQAAKEALQISGASARGVGEDILLYDNNLPEGRFYCRTVVIVVRTLL